MNTFYISLSFIIPIIIMITFYLIYFLKSRTLGLLVSLITGFLSMITFLVVLNYTSVGNNVDSSLMNNWDIFFGISGTIFIDLILIAVPVFLVLVVASLVFGSDFSTVKKKTYGISFLSLWLQSIIGITIAICLIPLVILIPNELWQNSMSAEIIHGEESATYNWIMLIVFGLMLLSFVIAIIMRITMKDKVGLFNEWTNKLMSYVTGYFKVIITLVPMVMFDRLTNIGVTTNVSEATSQLAIMGIYFGLFILGSIIIIFIISLMIILMSDKGIQSKDKIKSISKLLLVAFSNQSTAATLPDTQEVAKDLGACEEITNLTPTKGLFMGMAMCNGFTPMLISIMILSAGGLLSLGTVLLTSLVIVTLSLSTSGAGSSDYWITFTTMKIMQPFGVTDLLFDSVYLNMIMVVQEVNEVTISKPINGIGHLNATLLTDKYHKRTSHDINCDCNKEENKNDDSE